MRKKLTALVTSLLMMSSLLTTAFAGDFAAVAHDHTHDDACLEIATEAVHIDVHDHTHDDACLEMATEAVHIDVHDHTHDDNCHDEEIVKTLESVEYNAPAQAVELSVISATAHTHNYTLKRSTVAPTCTSRGYTVYRCTRCTQTIKKDYTPAKGHNYTQNAGTIRSATCTGSGLVIKKCSRCSSTTQVNTSALGHSYSSVSYAATCTSPARTVTTCTRCGISSTTTSGTVAGHNFSQFVKTTKAATCTEAGSATYKCSRCSATTSKTVNALGHSYSVKTVAPTCTADGYNLHTCTRSGCTKSYKSNTISKLGHNYTKYVKTTKAATCTEKGAKTYKCSRCSATQSKTVNALGHSYSVKTVAPTCTADGYNLHTCTRSGCTYSYKSNIISKLGHSLKSTNYAATCTSPARTTTVCTRSGCNHNSTTTSGQPLGHNFTRYVNTIKQASCYESGSATYQCTRCLKNTTKTINATGHTYSTNTIPADCTQPERVEKKCVRCSYVATTTTVGQPLGHKFNIYVETIKEPTCSEEGQARYQCTRCTKSTVETLDKLPCQYEIVGLYKPATCTTHQLDVQQCTGCGNVLYGVPNYDVPLAPHAFPNYTLGQAEEDMLEYIDDEFLGTVGFDGLVSTCEVCGEQSEPFTFEVTNGCPDLYFDTDGTPIDSFASTDMNQENVEGNERYVDISCNMPVILTPNEGFVHLRSVNCEYLGDGSIKLPAGTSRVYISADAFKVSEIMQRVLYSGTEHVFFIGFDGDFRESSVQVTVAPSDVDRISIASAAFDLDVYQRNPCVNNMNYRTYINSMLDIIERYKYSNDALEILLGLRRSDEIESYYADGRRLEVYASTGSKSVHYIEYSALMNRNTKTFTIQVFSEHGMQIGDIRMCAFNGGFTKDDVVVNAYDSFANTVLDISSVAISTVELFTPLSLSISSDEILNALSDGSITMESSTDLEAGDAVEKIVNVISYFRCNGSNISECDSFTVAEIPDGCYLNSRVDGQPMMSVRISERNPDTTFKAYWDVIAYGAYDNLGPFSSSIQTSLETDIRYIDEITLN